MDSIFRKKNRYEMPISLHNGIQHIDIKYGYNPFTSEYLNIKEWLTNDSDNIVFIYTDVLIIPFCCNRNDFINQISTNSRQTINSSIHIDLIYECNVQDYSISKVDLDSYITVPGNLSELNGDSEKIETKNITLYSDLVENFYNSQIFFLT